MLHSYNIKKETIFNYNDIFVKKVNKPNKVYPLKSSLLIFLVFCVISYISITPSFLSLNNKMNLIFFIVLIVCIYFVYVVLKKFFKTLNNTQIVTNDMVVNNFFKESYIATIDDNLNILQIKNEKINITVNLLNDVSNICFFKDFISVTFYGNTIFLPNDTYIVSFLKTINKKNINII